MQNATQLLKQTSIMKNQKDSSGFVSKRECIDFTFIKCLVGYEVNDSKNECVDINECKTTRCPKYSNCVNSEGSYHCQCKAGYEPSELG